MDPNLTLEYESFEERHWWSVARRDIIHAMLDRYVPGAAAGKGRWLDVGCGTGAVLGYYTGFAERIGAELDPGSVERGRAKGRDIRPTRPNWDFTEFGLFDCASMFDVLEHVEHEGPAVDAVYRVLKDDGILLVTVPALMSLWSDHDVVAHHFRRYRARELLKRFQSDQWQALKVSYFSTMLFTPIWAARQWNRLKKRVSRKAAAQAPRHDIRFGNPVVDRMLENIFRFEKTLLRRVSLPIGSSVLLVLRKKPSGTAVTNGTPKSQEVN